MKKIIIPILLSLCLVSSCDLSEILGVNDYNAKSSDNIVGGIPSTDWLIWEDNSDSLIGNIYYLDPILGDINNPGTEVEPWPSLQEVVDADMIQRWESSTHSYYDGSPLVCVNPSSPIEPGDTLILRNGNHGSIRYAYAHNPDYIKIKAAPGESPVLRRLNFEGVEKVILEGLTISGELEDGQYSTLLRIAHHDRLGPSKYIVIRDCSIESVEDISSWSASDWNNRASNGVSMTGDHISLYNTTVRNVNYGITLNGNFMHANGNTVENFCGDALRGNGNDQIFDGNLVMNCFDVNNDHRDGFQSFSVNGQPPRERVIIRNNTIIGYTDPNQPYAGTLQGIGCFDGFYIDWVVENNIIVTDHYHGISFYGAKGVHIRNNTVADINPNETTPSIRIVAHKDGRASTECVIANNIAPRITTDSDAIIDSNLIYTDNDAVFVNYADLDLRHRQDCAATNAGNEEYAAEKDINGVSRVLMSDSIDIGAYELY